jgi:Pyridoxamine 5'-phosphate oxidase
MVLAGILLAVGSGFASHHLGANTDTDQMFSASLPWRQRAMALDRAFPQFQGLLVAVVDANVPEEAEETARDLTRALAADHKDFSMGEPGPAPLRHRAGRSTSLTPMWFDHADGEVLVNTASHRNKCQWIRNNSRLSVLLVNPKNPYHRMQIKCTVRRELRERRRATTM